LQKARTPLTKTNLGIAVIASAITMEVLAANPVCCNFCSPRRFPMLPRHKIQDEQNK
jgi:hypothetical protein